MYTFLQEHMLFCPSLDTWERNVWVSCQLCVYLFKKLAKHFPKWFLWASGHWKGSPVQSSDALRPCSSLLSFGPSDSRCVFPRGPGLCPRICVSTGHCLGSPSMTQGPDSLTTGGLGEHRTQPFILCLCEVLFLTVWCPVSYQLVFQIFLPVIRLFGAGGYIQCLLIHLGQK